MSESETQRIKDTLSELEERVQARIGRWALAIIGTVIALAVGASSQWFSLQARMDRIEVWKAERTKPIEDYYAFKEEIAARLARLEEGQKTNAARLEAIQSAINALAARR